MKSKTSGYKGMLRDRIPYVVDCALKWQKAKERWIDHAYVNFIRFYCDNNERKQATRIVLGIAKFYREFKFDKSIDWDNLSKEDEAYWRRISSWVDWFTTKYAYMESIYKNNKSIGKDDFSTKVEIVNKYLTSLLPTEDMSEEEQQAKYEYVDKLVDFLMECFKQKSS